MKKERTFYDYKCRKNIPEKEVKKHMLSGCAVEGTPEEFFEEIEKEAINSGLLDE